jgi:hypothetical protein
MALICGMLMAASTGVMAGSKSGATSTEYKSGMQQTGQRMSDQNISATVQEIDQQDNKVTLQFRDGNSVELQVPQQMLSDLQQGDSVNVSIQKSGKSGMGTQPGQTGGMTQPRTQ